MRKRNYVMIFVMTGLVFILLFSQNQEIMIINAVCGKMPDNTYSLCVARVNSTIASMNVSNTTDTTYNFGVVEGT